ncbi:MAG: YfhO family protein [Ruminococcus sp.]|nr:YfhO family protein [Ruminococcus sp.]
MMSAQATKQPARSAAPKQRFREFALRNRYLWLSFLVPFVLMVTAFALMSVSPFGDKQILVTDLWHQYYPFLVDFQHKLQHGESFFWTWSVGGGVNYFSLMSYYLASPVNFLSVFIPVDWLREFLMFSVCLKVALGGAFTAYFLKSVYKRNDVTLVMFACCFSFCAFFMGYYWNTIWLDTVCITPLVALGTVKLLTENRFRLFTVSLALSLIMNYYIGLFVCVFVLMIFIGYSIVYWSGVKSFFVNLIKTGVFSAIAIGLTTFFLLPAFMALQNTHASGSSFPTYFAINIGGSNDLWGVLKALKSITGSFANFTCSANKAADALPNISCSAFALFFWLLSFTSPKIRTREKVVSGALVFFMFLSCVIRQLDYIWHGFHFTNMIPYRFTFLISFIVIVMAHRAFMTIDSISVIGGIIASALSIIVVMLGVGDVPTDKMFTDHPDWLYPTLIASAALLTFISMVVLLYTRRIIPKNVMVIALMIVTIGQSGVTAYFGVNRTTVTTTMDYPRGGVNTASVINYMDNLEKNTPELWRAEMTTTQTLNDGAINHYNGLSMFNSMANENMTRFFENFGMMGWKSGNRYTYAESSPVTNLFMNLKYLIARNGTVNNTYDFTDVTTIGGVKLAENTHYIPMGFITDRALMNWQENDNEDQFNPFDQQNEFFQDATGIHANVYERLEVVSQGHTDASQFAVNKTEYGLYSFNCIDTSITPHVKWNYEAPQDGLYMMYADIQDGDDVTIMRNDTAQPAKYGMARSYIACIGYFNKGDKISVYADLKQGSSGTARVYVDMLNQSVFEAGYEKLTESVMTTTSLTSSSMQGTIDVKKAGLFYTSVPYEKGWTARVDGKEVKITPVGNSLLAFPLSEGEHEISLNYYPNGFWPGFAVSVICAALFAGMCVLTYVLKKKLIPDPVFTSQISEEETTEAL